MILSPQIGGLVEAKVHNLIDEDGRCWRTDLINETLMDFEVALVKSIPFCITEQPDELIWPHSATSTYTVKTGYRFSADGEPESTT